ncbi:MAG: cell division protein FtsQ/DivIB [Sterolibacterium sp.]|nr:cell division protein FtsQ/DivIB [Sterolibacterium sp.]MBP9800979.1 cell division protein FtsQ/DivIB [Sterolibacterium sp.]
MAKTGKFSGLLHKADMAQRAERRRKARPPADGFWDRPPLINLLADFLMLFGILGLIYAGMLSLVRLPLFPVSQVVIASPLDQVTRTQIEYAVQHSLEGNFFTINLDNMRASFEKLPWVRHASVRRRWPDGIEVELEEHVAVARWQNAAGEMRLVNWQGEVFGAALGSHQGTLPLFGGPEGSASRVLAQYEEFRKLLAAISHSPRAVLLSPREAWQVRLDDGLVLELGRNQNNQSVADRLQRFVATYDALKPRVTTAINTIDMRYPNGFALRLAQAETGRARSGQSHTQGLPLTSRGNTGKGNT